MQVNRSLTDPDMDAIDHALGRPVNPMGKTFRNHFVTEKQGAEADAFRASRYWRVGLAMQAMQTFHVTEAGRYALFHYLRNIGDPHRLFVVNWRGEDLAPIAAKTYAKARYSAWLRADFSDLSFGEFVRETRVRLVG